MMLCNIKYFHVFITFFTAFNSISLQSNTVFMPNENPDLSRIPNYSSDMLKEERVKNEDQELKSFESTVKNIVTSNDKDLEAKADELINDKKQLDQFLNSFKTNGALPNSSLSSSPTTSILELEDILNLEYEHKVLLNNSISLNLKSSNSREVIELIGKSASLNFIIDPAVNSVLSNINFNNISLSSALKIVLSSSNPRLALVKEDKVFRIMNFVDAIPILKFRKELNRDYSLVSDFRSMFNAKWSESFKLRAEKMWYGIIGNSKNRSGYYLSFDDETKKLFFKGNKIEVEEFKKYLEQIDIRIPQVKIEARVVIAAKDFEESFGLQVGGVYNRSSSISNGWGFAGFGPVTTGGSGDIKPGNIADWALNLIPDSASKFLNFPAIFGGRDLDSKRLNLVLNAAENKSEIETILKPNLFVNSDESAEILVGQEVPIETNVQERIEGSLRNIDTISYKDLGMKLKVKPRVSPDQKSVFLDIFVEHSYFKDTTFNAKSSVIVMNKTKNRVLLKSGQTTLIGGLISNEKRKTKNGIPILQNIPALGWLFSGRRKLKSDDQLMIFITPTII